MGWALIFANLVFFLTPKGSSVQIRWPTSHSDDRPSPCDSRFLSWLMQLPVTFPAFGENASPAKMSAGSLASFILRCSGPGLAMLYKDCPQLICRLSFELFPFFPRGPCALRIFVLLAARFLYSPVPHIPFLDVHVLKDTSRSLFPLFLPARWVLGN